MKKFTFTTLCMACAMSVSASAWKPVTPPNTHEVSKYGFFKLDGMKLSQPGMKAKKANSTPTVEDLLGCPDGTVFGGEYSEETSYWSGTYSADEARQDMPTSFFQSFTDNSYTFTGVRFVATFNYWDSEQYSWFNCDSRGDVDENGDMHEPIRVHIGFWDEGEDGLPGKEVWGKDFDILGENTGIVHGDEASGKNYLYSFSTDLGDTIKMEHGFMQITAVDMKEDVSCYMAMFTCGQPKGEGYVRSYDPEKKEYSWMGCLPTVFCFKGDGSFIAKKALKVSKFLAPQATADGKHTKVRVQLNNEGSETYENPVLQLIVDGKAVATETVKAKVASLDNYNYTFSARADLSEAGNHTITVKNVTPGDEKISVDSISMQTATVTSSEYGKSASKDENHLIYITSVKAGDINNTSDASLYSDYTDKKTTLQAGDSLQLTLGFGAEYASVTKAKAWVDWNSNGKFEDSEAVTFSTDDPTKGVIRVPAGLSVTPGDKRLRIIASHNYYISDVEPTGTYSYGETEDYTITLKANENKAVGSISTSVIDERVDKGASKDVAINFANSGKQPFTADLKLSYILPNAPTADYHSDELTTNKTTEEANKANIKVRRAPAANREATPASDEQTQYTLKYDNGQYDIIGLGNYSECTYATYYPGDMVKNLKGMTISSVDVYLGTAAKNSSIVVYGQKDQAHNGALLNETPFATQANTWNHVVLSKPVTIGEEDLWIGVKLSGFGAKDYNMGIDYGSALANYGDRVNVGGETWWSMSELGINSNYTIRANVTGERTAPINWLSVDKNNVVAEKDNTATINVKLNGSKLESGLYEAYIEVKTNDELLKTVVIPVYLQNGEATGIINKEVANGTSIKFSANGVSVEAGKQIATVSVATLAGANIASSTVNANSCTIGFNAPEHTIYIVTVKYADGSKYSVKVPAL